MSKINLRYRLSVFIGIGVALFHAGAAAQNGFDLSSGIIPRNEILPGGPPRDGIPAIDQPHFVKPNEANFLRDEDRVLSVKIDNETRAYPLTILAWHEIVNDQIGDHAIAVTYCPLAAITAHYPDACLVIEALLTEMIGVPVKEQCTHGQLSSCCFEVPKPTVVAVTPCGGRDRR